MKTKPKIGLISCSGEDLSEGMISRVATRKILGQRDDAVTICLPLFLAGGQAERDFAKNHLCITVDGCDKMCAAKGVKKYGNVTPISSIVITDIAKKGKCLKPTSKSRIEAQDEAFIQQTMKIIDDTINKVKEQE